MRDICKYGLAAIGAIVAYRMFASKTQLAGFGDAEVMPSAPTIPVPVGLYALPPTAAILIEAQRKSDSAHAKQMSYCMSKMNEAQRNLNKAQSNYNQTITNLYAERRCHDLFSSAPQLTPLTPITAR